MSNSDPWGSSVSETFNGVNGVRQGGVISPILFTVYMDQLILKLKTCEVGLATIIMDVSYM